MKPTKEILKEAKAAKSALSSLSAEEKNEALLKMAESLVLSCDKILEKTLELWGFDKSCQTEEHECYCRDNQAVIRDDPNFVTWTIEMHQLDVEIAVEVEGGLVRNIYANADVSPDVYDLDVSAYPDEGEQEAADAKANELKTRVNQHSWRSVW